MEKDLEKLDCVKDFNQFLIEREMKLNKKALKKREYTHRIYASNPGRIFNIQSNEQLKFLELYYNASISGYVLHLFKKSQKKDSLNIQLSFTNYKKDFELKYDEDDIKNLIKIINDEILKINKSCEKKLISFVLEKRSKTSYWILDEVHIKYPYIIFDSETSQSLLDKIQNQIIIKKIFKFKYTDDDYLNTVIFRNELVLFHSKKIIDKSYKLTNIYTYCLNNIEITNYNDKDIFLLLNGTDDENVHNIKLEQNDENDLIIKITI